MLSIARNIWLICTQFNIQSGSYARVDNRAADILSRWESFENPHAKLVNVIDDNYIINIALTNDLFYNHTSPEIKRKTH